MSVCIQYSISMISNNKGRRVNHCDVTWTKKQKKTHSFVK